MKCTKANTDQSCELVVCANGLPCTEYILESHADFSDRPSNILQCFIPVTADDTITIHGTFNGTVLHGCFDLLADGSFLADKRIEGSSTGELKHYNPRRLDFQTVFDVVAEEGSSTGKVIEGVLTVQNLVYDDDYASHVGLLGQDGHKLGLGSIAVVISLNENTEDSYDQYYNSMIAGEWQKRGSWDVADGGVSPTQELFVIPTNMHVQQRWQAKHRRHFMQTRFGKAPWATFVFFYREEKDINEAGCMVREDEYQPLKHSEGPDIAAADPTAHQPYTSPFRGLYSRMMGEQSGEGSAQKKPSGMKQSKTPSPYPSHDGAKMMDLGQQQFQSSPSTSSDGLFVGQTARAAMGISPFEGLARDYDYVVGSGTYGTSEQGDDVFGPGPRNLITASGAMAPPPKSSLRSTASNDVEMQDLSITSPTNLTRLQPSTPIAAITPAANAFFSNRSAEKFASRGAPAPSPTRRSISYDEIRRLASPGGAIAIEKLARYCDEHSIPQHIGLATAQEICFKAGRSYNLLRPDDGSAWAAKPIKNPPQSGERAQSPGLFVGSDEESEVEGGDNPKTSELRETLSSSGDGGAPVTDTESGPSAGFTAASPSFQAPRANMLNPLKRQASLFTADHLTPTKKTKLTESSTNMTTPPPGDHQTRMAALAAELAEKNARIEAAKQAKLIAKQEAKEEKKAAKKAAKEAEERARQEAEEKERNEREQKEQEEMEALIEANRKADEELEAAMNAVDEADEDSESEEEL